MGNAVPLAEPPLGRLHIALRARVAREVFLATDAAKLMKDAGMKPPGAPYKKFAVMGKEFDPAKPDAYLASFAIKRKA